jgi:hypothetical protein
MQTMKSVDDGFAAWWNPHQKWLARDPLMQFFKQPPDADPLHEGELPTTSYTIIGGDQAVDIMAVVNELNKHAPPNTVGTFFGDPLGGNGWEVKMPDGSIEKVYFELPTAAGIESGLQLPDPPLEHARRPIADPLNQEPRSPVPRFPGRTHRRVRPPV